MEHLILFNGTRVLLTTAEAMSEVQNFEGEADLVIGIGFSTVRILRLPLGMTVEIGVAGVR